MSNYALAIIGNTDRQNSASHVINVESKSLKDHYFERLRHLISRPKTMEEDRSFVKGIA